MYAFSARHCRRHSSSIKHPILKGCDWLFLDAFSFFFSKTDNIKLFRILLRSFCVYVNGICFQGISLRRILRRLNTVADYFAGSFSRIYFPCSGDFGF